MPELLPTLRYLRKKGTRIIASIGYPLLIDLDRLQEQKFAALHQAVFAFFDTFLIHTPKDLETPYIQKTIQSPSLSRSYAAIMKNLKKKIIYTGYVFPEKMITGGTHLPVMTKCIIHHCHQPRRRRCIPKTHHLAIEAQRLLDNKIQTIIACGPATTSKEMALFKSCLKPKDKARVFLADHLLILMITCAPAGSPSAYAAIIHPSN